MSQAPVENPPRIRREPATRTGPVRNGRRPAGSDGYAAGHGYASNGSSNGNGRSNGNGNVDGGGHPREAAPNVADALEVGLEAAREMTETADGPFRGVIERGVAGAYALIDEYLMLGRAAAGRHHQHEHQQGSETMHDRSRQGGDWNAGWGSYPPGMAPWMIAGRMWADWMSYWVPTGRGMSRDGCQDRQPCGCHGHDPCPRITYTVASKRRVKIWARIDADAHCAHLKAEALTMDSAGKKQSIGSPTISTSGGEVAVTVDVPDKAASGVYIAYIADTKDGRRCGQVTLEIPDR